MVALLDSSVCHVLTVKNSFKPQISVWFLQLSVRCKKLPLNLKEIIIEIYGDNYQY